MIFRFPKRRSLISQKHHIALLTVLILSIAAPILAHAWSNDQRPSLVLGYNGFDGYNQGGTSQYLMDGPIGIAVDPTTGKVFVSDRYNSRVLRFPSVENMRYGYPAEAVLGQSDFVSSAFNTTQNGMYYPAEIALDTNGTLWVADVNNSRILRFDNAVNKANGAAADGVLGQPDFTSSGNATTQNTMRYPYGLTISTNGTLWVSDGGNNRILRFDNARSKANGDNADGVLGQPDFTSSGIATTQNGIRYPYGLTISTTGTLWVADKGNNRILRFDNAQSKANGDHADGVLGQPDFMSSASATTQNGLWGPAGLSVDNNGNLWVADAYNNRVLQFVNASAEANGANADCVLGQTDYFSNYSQYGMNYPLAVTVDNDQNLWVANYGDQQALYFINNTPSTNTPTTTNTFTAISTATDTVTSTVTPTSTSSSTFTNTASATPTSSATVTYTETPTYTLTDTPSSTATNTFMPTFTPSSTFTNTASATATYTATPTNTLTNTATKTMPPTDTATNTPTVTRTPTSTSIPARIDTIGIFRAGTFYLRLHNSTGNADLTVAFTAGTKPYPIVGDWTGAGFDTVGVYDQSNGQFSLCTANVTASCANVANQKTLVLGVPNDQPLSGRWLVSATNAGVGVFRPSNGLIYLKNALSTGFADYTMVLGIPGDTGLAGDWNGKGFDSPGVYRPSNSHFYLSNQVTNGSVIGDYQFQYGVGGDAPVSGDWIGQGHDGVGLFRQSNGFTYLKNQLVTGYADNSFTYGVAGDVPVAGHWQAIYPPIAPPVVLVPKTVTPSAQSGSIGGDNQIGD